MIFKFSAENYRGFKRNYLGHGCSTFFEFVNFSHKFNELSNHIIDIILVVRLNNLILGKNITDYLNNFY